MPEKIGSTEIMYSANNQILSLAVLFKGNFSIDWLLELSGEKASKIMTALEQGVQQGTLSRNT